MIKKIISFLLSFIFIITLAVPAFAQSKLPIQKEQMLARGLTEANIETLNRLSFTPEDILKMSVSDYEQILGLHFYNPKSNNRSTIVFVTGIPDEYYGPTLTFLSNCGFFKGDFYADNSGAVYQFYINKFAKHAFSGKL